jgi:hypothetical protein
MTAEPPLLHENKALNPWRPITDAQQLRVLGKLGEELGEASAIVSRCIIQGVDEAEPVTGKLNRVALENELADVLATIRQTVQHYGLDEARMAERGERKRAHLEAWADLIA